MGKRTDIYVDIYVANSHITAIIEVKGCWNKQIDTAMQTQLLNDYLKRTGHTYGLFVIRWYHCALCKKCTSFLCKSSIAKTQRKYDLQANNLSKNGIYIRAVVLNSALQ